MIAPYYADESVRLYLGDCREITEWLTADVLVTDPPYGIGWKRSENKARSSAAHKGITNDADTTARDTALQRWGEGVGKARGCLRVLLRAVSRRGPAGARLAQAPRLRAGGLGDRISSRCRADLPVRHLATSTGAVDEPAAQHHPQHRSPTSPAGRTGHPHCKPLDLMEALIASCPPGVIADPFAGSGSTLVAARRSGRQAIGVELDERYCELAARRLDQGVLPMELR